MRFNRFVEWNHIHMAEPPYTLQQVREFISRASNDVCR